MKGKRRQTLPSRMLTRDGPSNIQRLGTTHSYWSDLYHLLLEISWPGFLGLTSLVYVVANALFALAYLAGGDCIANAKPGSFPDAFFFSVQTLATIGYGAMYPRTPYANALVAIEALAGLLGVAMVTGLAFSRFSRPDARVLFSNVAVICPFDGVPTLMFRTANQRYNQILEAQVMASLARNEVNKEGQFMRRLYDLKLMRSQTPIFSLSWTVMHQIDESSPLYGATPESLEENEIEILITLTGIDETVSQTVHARHSFLAREILWNVRFADILSRLSDGRRVIDYRGFHDVAPLE